MNFKKKNFKKIFLFIDSYNKKHEPIAILLEGSFESVFKDKLVQKTNQIQLKEKSIPTKMIVIARERA